MLVVRAANGFRDLGECFRSHNLSQGQSKAVSGRRTGPDYVTDWRESKQKSPAAVIV
jgi:hypothetical protein